MSASPALSSTSSFSSVSSFSSDSDKSFSAPSNKHLLPPALRRQRPSHKRTTSEFTVPSMPSHKIRKTAHRSNKNILLWPSQLHSLNVASQEAKQRANTPAVSRQPSMEPLSSNQPNPVLLGYMELLQRQREENLANLRQRTASPSTVA